MKTRGVRILCERINPNCWCNTCLTDLLQKSNLLILWIQKLSSSHCWAEAKFFNIWCLNEAIVVSKTRDKDDQSDLESKFRRFDLLQLFGVMGGTTLVLIVIFSDLSKLFRDLYLIKRVALARGPFVENSALGRSNVDEEFPYQDIIDTWIELIHILQLWTVYLQEILHSAKRGVHWYCHVFTISFILHIKKRLNVLTDACSQLWGADKNLKDWKSNGMQTNGLNYFNLKYLCGMFVVWNTRAPGHTGRTCSFRHIGKPS